jgi:pyridoxine/pyridoxamine 5'-phosphate oxidase
VSFLINGNARCQTHEVGAFSSQQSLRITDMDANSTRTKTPGTEKVHASNCTYPSIYGRVKISKQILRVVQGFS